MNKSQFRKIMSFCIIQITAIMLVSVESNAVSSWTSVSQQCTDSPANFSHQSYQLGHGRRWPLSLSVSPHSYIPSLLGLSLTLSQIANESLTGTYPAGGISIPYRPLSRRLERRKEAF